MVSIRKLTRWPMLKWAKPRRLTCGRASSLVRDERGLSFIELALVMPVMLTLGLFGTEIAYMALIKMQVGQIATSVADNASRLGQTDNSAVTPTVSENQIDSLMSGAMIEGDGFQFHKNGRIILSSLEYDTTRRRQYIHWQRCSGELQVTSNYGAADPNMTGTVITGMGEAGSRVTASTGIAIMFVEVTYDYQPLFGKMFVDTPRFRREAAFMIRDDRNLTKGVTPGTGTPKSRCT